VEPTEHNRRAWDEIHRRRADATDGQLGIPTVVGERLPDLKKKHVLHLQCATGEASAQLAELGALVTGVDISAEAAALARERAPNAVFIEADVHELPLQLQRGRFDLVFTGGPVASLTNLDAWAGGIISALKPGGMLLAYDDHPVSACVDPASHWREDYFGGGYPQLGQIVTAVAGAGLTVRSLEEFSTIYETFQREKDPRVPGQFVLLADKLS